MCVYKYANSQLQSRVSNPKATGWGLKMDNQRWFRAQANQCLRFGGGGVSLSMYIHIYIYIYIGFLNYTHIHI